MKTAITIISLTLSLFCKAQENVAPELISSGGGHAELSTMNVTFSIGEPIVGLTANSGAGLTQGFHQTNLSITSIEELEELGISVYPNPTKGLLTIELDDEIYQDIEIQIHDNNGRKVFNALDKQLNRIELDLSEFSSGSYTVTLLDGTSKLGTTKIIKQ